MNEIITSKSSTETKIALMRDYLNGKTVQLKRCDWNEWENFTYTGKNEDELIWDFSSYMYRLKPTPAVRYIIKYQDGSIGTRVFEDKDDAQHYIDHRSAYKDADIIKMVEELE